MIRRIVGHHLPQVAVLGLVATVLGCGTGAPRSFQSADPVGRSGAGWATIEVRDDLTYNEAWEAVLELLVNDFPLEMAQRENGYVRSKWLYSWSGLYDSNYRVRITVKFDPSRRNLRFLTEAHHFVGDEWVIGIDNRLINTLKTDLMGTVGRVTR